MPDNGYDYSPYGGGYGYINDRGGFTGYGYGTNPYSDFGFHQDQKPF